MIYIATKNRVAVDLDTLGITISTSEALQILERKGLREVSVDLIAPAREQIGRARYKRHALMHEAPEVLDCISLIKWLYAKRGIWLPRNFARWTAFGTMVPCAVLQAGDLVFTSGYINCVIESVGTIGHVGMCTDEKTVIHATNNVGVEEVALDAFFKGRDFACARRIIPIGNRVITLEIPAGEEFETSEDVAFFLTSTLTSQYAKQALRKA